MKTINWTREKLEQFKRDFAQAMSTVGPFGTFTFEGNDFFVSYAKYLIEYLENTLSPGIPRVS